MNQKNYSELSEREKNDLFNQFKKKSRRKSNILLIIYILIFIGTIVSIMVFYNNWKSDYIVDDLVSNYIKHFFIVGIVLSSIVFIIVVLLNIIKRKKLKKIYTREFQLFLIKRNIILDNNSNQNKSI